MLMIGSTITETDLAGHTLERHRYSIGSYEWNSSPRGFLGGTSVRNMFAGL
jgi:hypothetical protein